MTAMLSEIAEAINIKKGLLGLLVVTVRFLLHCIRGRFKNKTVIGYAMSNCIEKHGKNRSYV